ncbi:hypothetical protein A2154_03035 [Candidatus Gottesmanbacteria bacterium RBG_16_43_7]|uniref:Glycosyltransferase RgtA/B/C/D-like domain-containing protein n=1 Tax=Candidatus Gottesmanbacteria bacterium RBG_16_43_7 TaxID=1798373 RepID=A0A1F5ZB70_9BACT|nr:MAG: hypothetical protein A2154_03035 [Candidatus Gottesmanbacteria bacterium RBG_16_43_7]
MKFPPEFNRICLALIIILLILWFIHLCYFTPLVPFAPPGDYQRDAAIIYNILKGNLGRDPTYLKEVAFYPYLYHLYMAGIHIITGIPVQTLLVSYPYLVSVPTLTMILLGSYWLFSSTMVILVITVAALLSFPWLRDAFAQATHSIILSFGIFTLTLSIYFKATTVRRFWLYILTGIAVALTIQTHLVAGMTISAVIFFQISYWSVKTGGSF